MTSSLQYITREVPKGIRKVQKGPKEQHEKVGSIVGSAFYRFKVDRDPLQNTLLVTSAGEIIVVKLMDNT